jgi:hypothetical protein
MAKKSKGAKKVANTGAVPSASWMKSTGRKRANNLKVLADAGKHRPHLNIAL